VDKEVRAREIEEEVWEGKLFEVFVIE